MSHKLTYTVGNPRVGKIIVAAQLANVQIINYFVEFKALETPAFLTKITVGKFPLLETPEGYLAQAMPYCNMLPEENLWLEQQIINKQWLDFTSLELEPTLLGLLLPILGFGLTTLQKQEEIKRIELEIKNIRKSLQKQFLGWLIINNC